MNGLREAEGQITTIIRKSHATLKGKIVSLEENVTELMENLTEDVIM